jgi:undecaprenyl-diphosphatase
MLKPMLDSILALDQEIFRLIHGTWHSEFWDTFFPYWRSKRVWIPVYVLVVFFFVHKYRRQGWFPIFLVLLTVSLSDALSSHVIKPWFGRLRPCHDAEVLAFHRMIMDCSSGFSFTSSHAANHFALSTIFWLLLRERYPRKRLFVLLYVWAASIAYGQVYVGVHYPLDILCGGVLGFLVAYGVYRLFGHQLPMRR